MNRSAKFLFLAFLNAAKHLFASMLRFKIEVKKKVCAEQFHTHLMNIFSDDIHEVSLKLLT